MTTLAYLGRALVLKPGSLGVLFEKHCTVKRTEVEQPCAANNFKAVYRTEPVPMFWYDTDPKDGQKVFCAYSGFGPAIEAGLRERGLEVAIENKVKDGLPAPDLSKLQGVTWRPMQKSVVAKIFAHRGGVIVCPTAFGKSFIATCIARAYPTAKIIVTVPSQDIAKGLYRELVAALGSCVGIVGAGYHKPKRVTVAVSQSLEYCDRDANIILADECHMLLTLRFIQLFNRFYRAKFFGFTASPKGRSDGADRFAEAVFGPELVNVPYQVAVDAGNIVPIKVRWVPVPQGPDLSNLKNKTALDRAGLWRNVTRNRVIATEVRRVEAETTPDTQILVMVDKIEHAFLLGQLLPEYVVVHGPIQPSRIAQLRRRGFMTENQQACTIEGRDYYRRMFEQNKLKRAISTMVWRQGVNFRDLSVLVRADGLGSKIGAIQIPGRLSRLGLETEKESGLLIDFDDSWNEVLKSRAESRITIYRSYGWEIENS